MQNELSRSWLSSQERPRPAQSAAAAAATSSATAEARADVPRSSELVIVSEVTLDMGGDDSSPQAEESRQRGEQIPRGVAGDPSELSAREAEAGGRGRLSPETERRADALLQRIAEKAEAPNRTADDALWGDSGVREAAVQRPIPRRPAGAAGYPPENSPSRRSIVRM